MGAPAKDPALDLDVHFLVRPGVVEPPLPNGVEQELVVRRRDAVLLALREERDVALLLAQPALLLGPLLLRRRPRGAGLPELGDELGRGHFP
jgi:hypothetical protein